MKPSEFFQSWPGKALIATALFAAGYYFPLFKAPGSVTEPAASAASASSSGASTGR